MASGAGSIRSLGKDKWELRVSLGRDPVTRKQRQLSRTFYGKQREAQKALASLVVDAEAPRAVNLFKDGFKVAMGMKTLTESTRSEYERTAAKRVLPVFGDRDVASISTGELDAFFAQLTAEGLKPSSIRNVRSVISMVTTLAVRHGITEINPLREATIPKGQRQPVTALSLAQIKSLMDAASPRLALFIRLAVMTGCRRGELTGLRWSDIDGTTVFIRTTRVVAGGKVVERSTTKTHTHRRLTIDDETSAMLENVRGEPAEFVFGEMEPDSWSQAFRRLAASQGIDAHVHQLRHTSASLQLGNAVDLRTVSNRLGHKDASLTLRTYSHLIPGNDERAGRLLGELLS